MKRHRWLRILISMIRNPLFVIAYMIACYNISILCKIGRDKTALMELGGCAVFFITWFVICIFRIIIVPKDEYFSRAEGRIKIIWKKVSILILILTTIAEVCSITHSAINFNGKLSWVVDSIFNEKRIEFKHNNIYDDGVEGILTDIRKKVSLPDDLYVVNGVDIKYRADGTITYFDAFLYGRDKSGKIKSYLINYGAYDNDKIHVDLSNYANDFVNEDKGIKALIDTVNIVNLKGVTSEWQNQDIFAILYYGKRSFGYNTEGIIYIDHDGNEKTLQNSSREVVGNTVSVYVPGKEEFIIPKRYNLVDDLENLNRLSAAPKTIENEEVDFSEESTVSIDQDTEFYRNDKEGYRLIVMDAAMGKKSYALNKTKNGGVTWDTINEDPFNGSMGVAAGITFVDEKHGFIILSHSGGAYADLYETKNGGSSFEYIPIGEIKRGLSNDIYEYYDFPQVPYEENGCIYMKLGQGSDGDYNGGAKVLLRFDFNSDLWIID